MPRNHPQRPSQAKPAGKNRNIKPAGQKSAAPRPAAKTLVIQKPKRKLDSDQ
jgi:hypothetical protein